jgi:hypothetical protein
MNDFEDKLREHCNIEFDKKTGEEIVVSSLSAVLIAFEEWNNQKRKIKSRFFQCEEGLTEWVNKNNVNVISICLGSKYTDNHYLLFYTDI